MQQLSDTGVDMSLSIVKPTIAEVQAAVHTNAKMKGFWEQSANIPEKLALIHSEVSEALEDYRNGQPLNVLFGGTSIGEKPVGFPSELADAVIRIMDLAGFLEIDLERAILLKHRYNLTRPKLHGGKKA